MKFYYMRKIRIGVVGVGIQGEAHVMCLKSLHNVELIGIADVNEKRARYIAEKYKIPKVYTDYRDLARDKEIEAITVATPDFLHKDPVIVAAENGKHVLVEKPMATSLRDAEDMANAVRRYDIKFMVNFENRFNPPFVKVKEDIDKGILGRPLYAYIRLSDTIYVPTQMIKWSNKTEVCFFLMSHTVDLARWYFNDSVKTVFATSRAEVLKGLGIDTPDMYVALLKFKKGGIAFLESCWILPNSMPSVFDFKFELICDKGAVFVNTQNESIERFTEGKWSYPHFMKLYSVHNRTIGFLREALGHFISCIAEDQEPLISVKDGLENVRILCKIRESASKGVSLSL